MRLITALALTVWVSAAAYGLRNIAGAGMFFNIWSAVLFAFTLMAAFSGGAWVLAKAGFDRAGKAAFYIPAALTLGLGMIVFGTFALGAAGLLYPAAQALLLGGFLWLGRDNFSAVGKANFAFDFGGWDILSAALFAVAFLICFVPPLHYDSLVYHLAMPQSYIFRHALVALPDNIYSHFPQNGEMLFTSALLLGSDLTAQLLSWGAAVLACWWIYSYARKFGHGGLAAFLAASHTAFLLLCTASYVETFVCLFASAALVSLLEWRVAVEEKQSWLWILLSGIFCGLALGTKYYSGITAIGLSFMGVYHCYSINRFSERKKRVIEMLAFVACVTLLFLPWLIKNAFETGNPVYPFLYHLFNATAGAGVAEAKAYFSMLTEYGYGGWFFHSLLRFPLLIFSRPDRFGGGMDVLGIFGWDMLFAALPMMWLATRKKPELRWTGAYLLIHFVLWYMTAKVLRFLVVLVPAAALLAAEGFYALEETSGRRLRVALWLGLACFTCSRLAAWVYTNSVEHNWEYVFGMQSRSAHLQDTLPYYPCAAAYNSVANAQSRILLAGEQRSYYVNGAVTATSLVHPNAYVLAANDAPSPEALAKTLARDYDWLVHTPKEEQRLRFYGTLNYSAQGRKNWDALLSSLRPAYKTDTCSLYKLP